MDSWQKFRRNWLWLVAGAVMAGLVYTDTLVQLRKSWDVTEKHISNEPHADSTSPTGYAYGQRDFILPYVGMDGYHWVMQTQDMLAGKGLRVRQVDYDNAPYGREVHWSSSFRWWVAGLAWVHHKTTGDPIVISVEKVMPYANTLLITLIILALLPVVARRFGALPATLLALGMIAITPVYIAFSEGKSDHHGLTVVTTMFTVLCLAAGGAGWVRLTAAASADPLENWLPERTTARRWFIGSGIAGGIGLWVSAASQIPVLAWVGFGALLATGWFARNLRSEIIKPDPALWRVWGWSGAVTSVFLYLLEYFPSGFGMRLEVNHPLFALAWAAGGELLCRLSRWLAGGRLAPTPKDRLALALSVMAVLAPLVVIVGFASRSFWVADQFLFNFHEDYIEEFKSMARYLVQLGWLQRAQAVNPLALLVFPLLLWIWRPLAALTLSVLLVAITVIALVIHLPWKDPQYPLWYTALAAEAALLGFFAWRARQPEFSPPGRALLVLVLLPAVGTYFLSLRQMRWMEIEYGLLLVGLIVTVTVLVRRTGFRWSPSRAAVAAFFLASVFLLSPIHMINNWRVWNWQAPNDQVEIMEVITRDVAQRLRARLGPEVGVIVSGPSTTTWMIYWGGFKGIGTLYWENLSGLKATGDIYAARSDAEAFELVKKYGVTHFAIFAWDSFAEPYARLKNQQRRWDEPPPDSFVLKTLHTLVLPRWLRPINYRLPGNTPKGWWVQIWEVVPEQTEEETIVRQAEWWSDVGNNAKAFELLLGVLKAKPNYMPALIAAARLAAVANQSQLFSEALGRIRTNTAAAGNLSLNDRLDLAVVFHLARDDAQAKQQLVLCIQQADEASLRRLDADALYNLLTMTRQLNIADSRPDWWDFGFKLLPAVGRAQVLVDAAGGEKNAGQPARAVAILRQALILEPNSVRALTNLAWILATSPDDSVRNGNEAKALALKACEIDQNEHVDVRDTLACAYAECGEFDKAIAIEKSIIKTAEDNKVTDLAKSFRERLALFEQRQPLRDK